MHCNIWQINTRDAAPKSVAWNPLVVAGELIGIVSMEFTQLFMGTWGLFNAGGFQLVMGGTQ